MKKTMKSFMAIALGLSLVLAGCSKDDDNDLSGFTGKYPVTVDVTLAGQHMQGMDADLILSEENGNFKASASLAAYGDINIVLSSLNPNLPDWGAEAVDITGYLFKVAAQTIQLALGTVTIKGADGEMGNGYHGYVAKGKLDGIEVKSIAIFLEGNVPMEGVDGLVPLYIEIKDRGE
jgi:hypothetical protein